MLVGVVMIFVVASLWQQAGRLQEQIARHQQEALGAGQEARALAKNASEQSLQTAAKVAVMDVKLNELTMQKAQVDEMMLSLSRSRVENLVIELEASLLLAQQQAQMTGSVEPLLTALSNAVQRIAKNPSPRLLPLENTLRREMDRLRTARLLDTPTLLLQVDELVQTMDVLEVANALPRAPKPPAKPDHKKAPAPQAAASAWYDVNFWDGVKDLKDQFLGLIRLQKIDNPEAALMNPEQAFLVRENVKLKLLNARIGLMTRQYDVAQRDLQQTKRVIERYFEVDSPRGAASLQLIDQMSAAIKGNAVPSIDASLNAVAAFTRRK